MKSLTHTARSSFRLHFFIFTVVSLSFCWLDFAFGAKDPTDVTAAVAAAVRDDRLSISATNEKFGDTAQGVPKKLHVEYTIGAEKLARDVNEGGKLEISAPAGKKLVILKAIYGPADGSKPATVAGLVEAPGELLDTLPGFKIEHVLQADAKSNGSWICMTKDPKGRLLLGGQSGQPITRVTIKDGKSVKAEILAIPVSETMGMLFVGDVLYISGKGAKGFALYRCKDTKGDDSFDNVEFLREWQGGSGEHGSHGLVLGQDKMLYAVCGNFTGVPKDLVESSPHRNYADDLALKRIEDGNGFGAGKGPPGGYVLRMDLDGKNAELFSAGQRNNYDIAFNADGELFGYDSDMEWDWGSPWYRPTRAFHSVRGGDQGFREGSAKWPEYYADGLPASVNIGIGCPTGVDFGTGAKFPAKYQKAFYICDWTYGRLMAVHLTPSGASYTGSFENFVAPKSLRGKTGRTPLNLTDVVIGEDGSLYFTTGGRGTQANLFRVSYTGTEAAVPLAATELRDKDGSEARALRHKLESFNVKADPAAIEFAWPHLNSPDRFIRYAARMAIERNPVSEWQAKALAEKQPDAAFAALLSLARLGGADAQPAIIKALAAFPFAKLTEEQVLNKLRVIEVSIARQGVPTGETATQLLTEVAPLYPAKTEYANRELCQILLALNAPNAVAKTVALLKAAPVQEEQVTYVIALRNIKTGWTEELRRDYFSWWNAGRPTQHPEHVVQWFKDVGINYNNGASFGNLLKKTLAEAQASMTAAELAAMGDLTQIKPAVKPAAEPRKFVKEWKTADLQPLLEKIGKGRNFTRGKALFAAVQCALCHRYGDQGGAAGPDLTAVTTRFKRLDILESMTEPSKVVSEQYMNTAFTMKDGAVLAGRIAQETADKIVILTNPFDATTSSTVSKAAVKSRELSKVSIMPPGLLNTCTQDEILDLLAFLESMGDPKHPNFSK
jgi:putative heme-binding domain-containing protein